MTSEKQILSNKKNALNSTGPQSDAGKLKSSKNAIKHYGTSQVWLMNSENRSVYNAMLEGLIENLKPKGEIQNHIVRLIMGEFWRVYRLGAIESQLFDLLINDGLSPKSSTNFYAEAFIRLSDKDLPSKLNRYRIAAENMLFRKLKELKSLQEKDSSSSE